MRMKATIITLVMAVLPACLGFAGGAGGTFYGMPYFDQDFSNYDIPVQSVGGFGYGVNNSGLRTGGFGMGFFGGSADGGLAGGVGGFMSGQEIRFGPVTIAVNLLTGLGGLGANLADARGGYMVAFGQLDAECGFAVSPWMQISAYGGIMGMGNLLPGYPMQSLLYYTPIVGVRVAWGSFGYTPRSHEYR